MHQRFVAVRGVARWRRAAVPASMAAVAALALAASGCIGDSVSVTSPGGAGVTAAGTGRVAVVPDIAAVNLGVEVTRPTVGEARTATTSAMDRLLTSLQANGVQERDIQTQGFSIYPQYGPGAPDRAAEISGYTVSNFVNVKIRNIDSVSTVLDGTIEAGGDAVRIHGVTFTVDQPEQFLGEARQKAIDDARERAEELARLAGVSLGDVVSVRESPGGGPIPLDASLAQRGGLGGGVSPGEAEIVLTVEVVYAVD